MKKNILKEQTIIKSSFSFLVAQSCLTLCDPMDCSLPGSSIHGVFLARVLAWVAVAFSGGSSRPRDRTQVSHIAGRRVTLWATKEAHPTLKTLTDTECV